MAAATVTADGAVFSGVSSVPARQTGVARAANPAVVDAARNNKAALGAGFGCDCAEVDSLSQALDAGQSLQGSVTAAAQVGARAGRPTGTIRGACASCGATISGFDGSSVRGR